MADVRLFGDLDAVVDVALGRDRQTSLYDRLEWFCRNVDYHVVNKPVLIAQANDGDAGAWLFLTRTGKRHAIQLGGWYTLSFAIVRTGQVYSAAIERCIVAIAGGLRRRLGHISLSPVGQMDAAAIVRGFDAAGWWTRLEQSTTNWVAHVSGEDFASYWKRRPSRLRNTFRRKQREARLEIVISDRFDPELWAEYESVYARSWKPEEGSPGFVRAMAEAEGAAGTLRLGIARRDGQAVAAQLWTVENDTAIIHKLAYDEAARAYSPGTVLSEAMFRHVIDGDRPTLIDFGTGDDPYKADWMDEKRPLYRVELYNKRSPVGWAAVARDRLARWRR